MHSSVLLRIRIFFIFRIRNSNIQIHQDEINRWKVRTEVERVIPFAPHTPVKGEKKIKKILIFADSALRKARFILKIHAYWHCLRQTDTWRDLCSPPSDTGAWTQERSRPQVISGSCPLLLMETSDLQSHAPPLLALKTSRHEDPKYRLWFLCLHFTFNNELVGFKLSVLTALSQDHL